MTTATWLDWLDRQVLAVVKARHDMLQIWQRQELGNRRVPSFENWLRMELAVHLLQERQERERVSALTTDGRLLKHDQPVDDGLVRRFKSSDAKKRLDSGKSFSSPDISLDLDLHGVRYIIDMEIKTQFAAKAILGDLRYVEFHNVEQRGTNYQACFLWCYVTREGRSQAVDKLVERLESWWRGRSPKPPLLQNPDHLGLSERVCACRKELPPWLGYALLAPGFDDHT